MKTGISSLETGFVSTNGLGKTSIKVFGKGLYSGEQPLTSGTPESIDQSRKLTLPNLLPPPQVFLRLRGDWGIREHARQARSASEE